MGDWSGAPGSARSTRSDISGGGGHQRSIVGHCWKCDRPGHRAADCQADLHQQTVVGHCWKCNELGHRAADCQSDKLGVVAKTQGGGSSRQPCTCQVWTFVKNTTTLPDDSLLYLLPDVDEDRGARVTEIWVQDHGSRPRKVCVEVAGVPWDGVVDTGADITLIGPEAFKRIAAVAKLHRHNFKPLDKTPRTYDQKTFHIDGQIDMDISFQECIIKTPD